MPTPVGGIEPRVRIPKAAEIVAGVLRNRIIRGKLKEGDSLVPEGELVRQFGISRPSLREAIRILESEGLLSIQRGARGGAFVHSPNPAMATRYVSFVLQTNGTTLMDIHRVHMLVEPAAARMVAEQYSKTAPAVLRACLEEGHAKFDSDFEWGIAAARFRNKLIELTNIPTLTLLMGMLNDIFERYWGTVTAIAGQQMDNAPAKRRGLKSLEKLVEYIAAADGEGAETYWRKHTTAVEKALAGWLPAGKVIDLLEDRS